MFQFHKVLYVLDITEERYGVIAWAFGFFL